jgi:cytochrome c biogenesis protein CcmG/thiol:disulfide interchange protein DsbE
MAERRGAVWTLAPVLAVLGLVAVFGFGLFREDADQLKSTLIAKPAPEFDLPGLRPGEPNFATAALTGPGVKLVNIWASWCGPCRIEHPALEKLAAAGHVLYGINYKDDPDKALKFLAELGDPFTGIGADEKGRAAIDWGVYGVPETFVIDGEGRIAYKHIGPIQNDDLETKILPAIEAAGG